MTHSDVTECPNCGKEASESAGDNPFSYTSIECLHCGFQAYPVVTYLKLKDLNKLRENNEMEPLKKLPEQDKNIW